MYPVHGAPMAPPQKPETFMLSNEAQQSLPHDSRIALQQVDNLKYFLLSAPVDWAPDQLIRRFLLPTGDYVSCVLWNNLFHISGTDIVRCLSFRFQAFGRPVKNTKKFEEGIFSDLRNLKAGTDASLEEPKSPFLDFLYKNNCIRTQKKQKVFYWYSVPHDRLFLDALERDLKREKMGQEPTTIAVKEPALSFQFDSSQSLFDQLTKAQQANSSSFSAHAAAAAATYSHSASPMVQPLDAMPPPPPQSMAPPAIPVMTDQTSDHMMYQPVGLASTSVNSSMIKAEQDFGPIQYDRNGLPIARIHQRHTSMPTYMEYSPAPSFVSSQYDDYGHRGISFEPVTPPPHTVQLGSEPAYIANEDTGLYSAIPDIGTSAAAYNPMMQLPPSNFVGQQFSAASRSFPSTNVYPMLEGSPTYKQRRRRSSIPPSITNAIAAAAAVGGVQTNQIPSQPHAVHRPSDLRRSMSAAQFTEDGTPAHDADPLPALNSGYPLREKEPLSAASRTGTPLPTLDETPSDERLALASNVQEDASLPNGEIVESSVGNGRADRPGPVRRARSATMTEMGPYPQKSHSCPIPSCGRLFKRLEHLKRHVRTHTQERPYLCPYCNKAFSRSDNLAQHRRIHETSQSSGQQRHHSISDEHSSEQEQEGGPADNASPQSDLNGLPTTISMTSMGVMPSTVGLPQSLPSMVGSQMISPQLLQQHINAT